MPVLTDTVNKKRGKRGGIAPKTLTEEVNAIDGIITGFCFNRERKQQSFTKNLRQECHKTTFCKISYLERHRFHDTLTEKKSLSHFCHTYYEYGKNENVRRPFGAAAHIKEVKEPEQYVTRVSWYTYRIYGRRKTTFPFLSYLTHSA